MILIHFTALHAYDAILFLKSPIKKRKEKKTLKTECGELQTYNTKIFNGQHITWNITTNGPRMY